VAARVESASVTAVEQLAVAGVEEAEAAAVVEGDAQQAWILAAKDLPG
jgi:hypothetical protein